MTTAYRFLATSDAPVARSVRRAHRFVHALSMPLPRPLGKLALWTFIATRALYHLGVRVLVCEPLFKAYCARHGRGLRTGVFVHWVQGVGDIVVGDDVCVDGKCSFTFAAHFADRPTLSIGDRTGIGHRCEFTVGKEISIGRDCRIAGGVWMFDSSGHPADPAARRAGLPPAPDEVRPVRIGDNVWIGRGATICPGVTVGDDSVVSAGAVVMQSVPPRTVVAGNPARRVATVDDRPAARAPAVREEGE